MLALTWIDFFLRAIPESILIIWGIHIICNECIVKSKYIVCCIGMSVLIYFVRKLPIHFGIHILINNVLTVCVLVATGMKLLKTIYGTAIVTLLLIIGEFINALILNILNVDVENQFKNALMKDILQLPSLIFLIFTIILIRFKIKGVSTTAN